MPIFRSDKPSSCVQCHLSSVDIKNYILPSHEDTFLAMREQGLIDVDRPDKSKILTLISMGERDTDPGARYIHKKTRQAEFEAFSAWINACCHDESLLAPQGTGKPGFGRSDQTARDRSSREKKSCRRVIYQKRVVPANALLPLPHAR